MLNISVQMTQKLRNAHDYVSTNMALTALTVSNTPVNFYSLFRIICGLLI